VRNVKPSARIGEIYIDYYKQVYHTQKFNNLKHKLFKVQHKNLTVQVHVMFDFLVDRSMEEAEAMCLRIGILVNGQFVAIGSCEQIKNRYYRHFILTIKVTPGYRFENLEKIKEIMNEIFPTIKLKETYLVSGI